MNLAELVSCELAPSVKTTPNLTFDRKDGQVTYFNGHMPLFIHAAEAFATFRMITAPFCITGIAKQADICRAFGITLISVKRAVQRYRQKGVAGFYGEPRRCGPAVMTEQILNQAQERAVTVYLAIHYR